MPSNNQRKLINKLKRKKFRRSEGLFVAEGLKVVEELLNSDYRLRAIFSTPEFAEGFSRKQNTIEVEEISEKELQKISLLSTPNEVLAVAEIPDFSLSAKALNQDFFLIADALNDPGNLGTLIRIADWFGIGDIVCSPDTVDAYNSKAVQSSMGSLFRVRVHYTDLDAFTDSCKEEGLTLYGASLKGESIYSLDLQPEGGLILGCESHGISDYLAKKADKLISIPGRGNAESLNVSVSAGILCSEFMKKLSLESKGE